MDSIDTVLSIFSQASKLHGLDPDLHKYALGYLATSTQKTPLEIQSFLFPILSDTEMIHADINSVCIAIANIQNKSQNAVDTQIKLLESSITIDMGSDTIEIISKRDIGDIRHGFTMRNTASTVDQRKLRNAEKKILEKKAARGGILYEGEIIPEWTPDSKPAIVVNQMKQNLASESRSKDVKLVDFDIQFAGKKILTGANLMLANGRRYGLVGKNGIGKSTLLRAIAHKELLIPDHIRVLHVEQEIAGDETLAIDSVLEADTERTGLLNDEIRLTALLNKTTLTVDDATKVSDELKEVYRKLDDIEADKAESKASAILNGLGFSPLQQQSATKTFSGGWRMRLALARALFCRPDLLLADEVTNYLDFPAVVWLENYFNNWSATLLVVSHDRSFLDAVSTDILHLHHGTLDAYKGSFSYFVATRAERMRNIIREYEAQLQYRGHLQDFIDRWRFNAKRAPQAQARIKILEKLPPLIAPPKDDMEGMGQGEDSIYFKFPTPEALSPPILQMDEVTFGYDSSRTILKRISFDLQMDSKVAIVGPNGAGYKQLTLGKSTMVYLLTEQVKATSGLVQRHGRLRIALFSQHHVDQVELGISSVSFLQSQFPGFPEEHYRRILGRFGLTGTSATQPIGTLSGGQKSRVVFSRMSMLNPHVLILDEPTNHLDMDSIDALANALRAFKGGVAIVSHDQRFLDQTCKEVWICDQGTLTRFEGVEGCQDGVVKQYKDSLVGRE